MTCWKKRGSEEEGWDAISEEEEGNRGEPSQDGLLIPLTVALARYMTVTITTAHSEPLVTSVAGPCPVCLLFARKFPSNPLRRLMSCRLEMKPALFVGCHHHLHLLLLRALALA